VTYRLQAEWEQNLDTDGLLKVWLAGGNVEEDGFRDQKDGSD